MGRPDFNINNDNNDVDDDDNDDVVSDFGGSGDEFFNDNNSFSPDPEESPVRDEEKLLQDGNEILQNHVEEKRKNRDYSSQTRDYDTTISMMYVDWSGFPAAAHTMALKNNNNNNEAGKASRRRSLQDGTRNPSLASMSGSEHRSSRLMGRRPSTGSVSIGDIPEGESLSSPTSTTTKRYRNRRHSLRASQLEDNGGKDPFANSEHSTNSRKAPHVPRAQRRDSLKGARAERAERRRHLNQAPSSPSGRIRRPSAAAASSTTLNVKRRTPQRTQSGMKRRGSNDNGGITTLAADVEMCKAASLRW